MTKIIITTKEELEDIIENSVRKILNDITPHSNSDYSEFMDVNEAAKYLKIAKQTLYSFTSTSQIPYIKNGKRILFKKDELDAWILKGRRKTVDEMMVEYKKNNPSKRYL